MSEDLIGTGLEQGPPYNYTYKVPAVLDSELDTPKFLVSGRVLERAGVLLQKVQVGEVPGALYEPKEKSDMEYRVSRRLFNLVKNTPNWYVSEDELRLLRVDTDSAKNGSVLGVAYDPVREDSRKFKVSTVHYKQLERILEEAVDFPDL